MSGKPLKFDVLERNKYYLTCLGIHWDRPVINFFKSLSTYYNLFFILGIFLASNIMLIVTTWPQLDQVLPAVSLAVPGLQVGGTFVSIGLSVKTMKLLQFELQKIVNQATDTFDIFYNTEQKCRKYSKTIVNFIYVNQIPHVGAFLFAVYNMMIDNYDTSTWILPFEVYLPFDATHPSGWFLKWFLVFHTCVVYISCFTVILSYFISCCFYIDALCENFDFLHNSAMEDVQLNLMEKNSKMSRGRSQQIREKMCKTVTVHVKGFE